MSSSPEHAVSHGTPNVLRILSGLHAGANRTLAEREMILVGSGEDCDIVLADPGVARHHALLNLLGDVSSLRALDAPLRVDGQPLHPGDPIELLPLQRIQLGDASIAYGAESDPRWAELQPGISVLGDAVKRVRGAGMRRLPMIVALAVLSLASLAIFAAVMPSRQHKVDTAAELRSMAQRFRVENAEVVERDGVSTLSGTVVDRATRDRMLQNLADRGISAASLNLRTGDQIASDVSEVLRTYDINAKTRYLGKATVEISGRFADPAALKRIAASRVMHDVTGLKFVTLNNLAEASTAEQDASAAPGAPGAPGAASAAAPTRIVSIARGKDPHLVALDGQEYRVGADIPGLGKLLSMGEMAQVMGSDGTVHPVTVEPVTAEELAAAADQQAVAEAEAIAKAAAAAAQPGKHAQIAASPIQPGAKPGVAATTPSVAQGQPQTVGDKQKR